MRIISTNSLTHSRKPALPSQQLLQMSLRTQGHNQVPEEKTNYTNKNEKSQSNIWST